MQNAWLGRGHRPLTQDGASLSRRFSNQDLHLALELQDTTASSSESVTHVLTRTDSAPTRKVEGAKGRVGSGQKVQGRCLSRCVREDSCAVLHS